MIIIKKTITNIDNVNELKDILNHIVVTKRRNYHNSMEYKQHLYNVQLFSYNPPKQIGIFEIDTDGYIYDKVYQYGIINKKYKNELKDYFNSHFIYNNIGQNKMIHNVSKSNTENKVKVSIFDVGML